jgi:hypothetical protein
MVSSINTLISNSSEPTIIEKNGCWSRLQKRMSHLREGLQNNWNAIKGTISKQKKTILFTAVELGAFAYYYASGQPIAAPIHSFIFYVGTHSYIASVTPPGPQDSPELLSWKKHLEILQQQHPIEKPVYLALTDKATPSCLGSEKWPCKQIIINVPKENTLQLTDEEKLFTIAHEYSHALLNDGLYSLLTTCLMQIGAACVFLAFSSSDTDVIVRSIQFGFLLKGVKETTHFIQCKYWEGRVDARALEFTPQKAISQGGVLFFERMRLYFQAYRSQPENTLFDSLRKKLLFFPNGNYLLDDHPLTTSRRDSALAVYKSLI